MTFIKQMKERPRQLLMIFLVGLLLLVISLPVEEKKEEIDSEQCLSEIKEDAYTKQLENKLEQVLTEMEGVGQVRVMMTFQESSEKIVEKDENNTVYAASSDWR